ncbi:beta-lactamase family protein [Phlyctema vagabunda]|uniref:Beta-lactamase family protein n=1 Tax=Phlyctema vagabunda TaxID=108571 RepID=A0ABR4PZL4_9HELO
MCSFLSLYLSSCNPPDLATMSASAIDSLLKSATESSETGAHDTHGVIFTAANLKKNFSYAKASGATTLSAQSTALTEDAVCFVASMTKLMTTIAAMQVVERGLIGLDDDVSDVLHEWKDAEILEGFGEDGKPILRRAKNKITLRLLLSHSSGIGYDVIEPKLIQWRQTVGELPGTFSGSIDAGFKYPLVYDPGEGWCYGGGLDWAGRLVERLNDNMRLGEYMEKNIWRPLGMTSTTFNIAADEALKQRLMGMSARTPAGGLVPLLDPVYATPAQDDCGGIGSYSTAPDYMKVVTALLQADERILKKSSIDEMFKPQLTSPKYLEEVIKVPELRSVLAGNFPAGLKVNFGLGGMLNMEPLSTGRLTGSMQWGGMPNLFWWVDRESGVCGTYFSQVMPTGDQKSLDVFTKLESEVYKV